MRANAPKKKFVVALPNLPNQKGFNCPTITALAKNISDCISIIRHLRPNVNIGDIKQVNY